MKITDTELEKISSLINELTGITIGKDKAYFVESRLSEIAQKKGLKTFAELHSFMRTNQDPSLKQELIDAITVNETFFFRDKHPFTILTRHLVDLVFESKRSHEDQLKSKLGDWFSQKKIHLWSAACSYGQEPYSVAIALSEQYADIQDWEIRILATDISGNALNRAREGIYSDFEVSRGLDESVRDKYFSRLEGGNRWQVRDHIRRMVEFRQLNLHEEYVGLGFFDIIFCRNVAIYFDTETKKRMFEKFEKVFNKEGWLMLGASESLTFITDKYELQRFEEGNCYKVIH
jgi:chemotaxis protein methyltransferase CheR